MSDQQHRSIAAISAELRDVQRHLREVPPHHGGGRADLEERADALRRELDEAQAAHRRQQQQQSQQQ